MKQINSDMLAALISTEEAIVSAYQVAQDIRDGIKALGFTDKEINGQKADLRIKLNKLKSKMKGGVKHE